MVDIFKHFKKEKKRNQLIQNKFNGGAKESIDRLSYELKGYKTKSMHKGADFIAEKDYNPITGDPADKKIVESKLGKSRLSKAQKEMQKKNKKNYVVERGNSWI